MHVASLIALDRVRRNLNSETVKASAVGGGPHGGRVADAAGVGDGAGVATAATEDDGDGFLATAAPGEDGDGFATLHDTSIPAARPMPSIPTATSTTALFMVAIAGTSPRG